MTISEFFTFAVTKRELVMVKHAVCVKPHTSVLFERNQRHKGSPTPQGVIVSWLFWQLRIDFKF